MSNLIQSTTQLALHIAGTYTNEDSVVVDATCGNGHDTLALAKADCACLYAFDVQQQAIDATKTLMEAEGFGPRLEDGSIRLIRDSHENMGQYLVPAGSDAGAARADLILFNLCYLPGGDKSVTTCMESTMNAIDLALDLLSAGGLISITMYSGHEEGAKEKAELLAFAKSLDSKKYHVAYVSMANQPNNPPELLLITRKK